MENSEILDFQFEPIKALQPDSSSGKNWKKLVHPADSEPSTTTRNEASVYTCCMCFNCIQMLTTKEFLFYHELNACKYFKIKKFLFIHNSANFFYQINQWYIRDGKSFLCFLRLYLISFFIACCTIHSFCKKLIYKKLELTCLKTQETSTAAITFSTNLSYIETRRQCKEYFEVIPLHCYTNTQIRFAINNPKSQNTSDIWDFPLANKIFHNNLCVYAFVYYHISSLIHFLSLHKSLVYPPSVYILYEGCSENGITEGHWVWLHCPQEKNCSI